MSKWIIAAIAIGCVAFLWLHRWFCGLGAHGLC